MPKRPPDGGGGAAPKRHRMGESGLKYVALGSSKPGVVRALRADGIYEGILAGVKSLAVAQSIASDLEHRRQHEYASDEDSNDHGVAAVSCLESLYALVKHIWERQRQNPAILDEVRTHAELLTVPVVKGMGKKTVIKLVWLWLSCRVRKEGNEVQWISDPRPSAKGSFVKSLEQFCWEETQKPDREEKKEKVWRRFHEANKDIVSPVQYWGLRICWRLKSTFFPIPWGTLSADVPEVHVKGVRSYVNDNFASTRLINETEYFMDRNHAKGVDKLIDILRSGKVTIEMLTGAGGQGKTYGRIRDDPKLILFLGPRKINRDDMDSLARKFNRDLVFEDWPNVSTSQRFAHKANFAFVRAVGNYIEERRDEGGTEFHAFIDEAGLYSSQDLARLLRLLVDAGINHVTLAGDERQCGMWCGGQPFRVLVALAARGYPASNTSLKTIGRDRVGQKLVGTNQRCGLHSAKLHTELLYFNKQHEVENKVRELLDQADVKYFSYKNKYKTSSRPVLKELFEKVCEHPDTRAAHETYKRLHLALPDENRPWPEFEKACSTPRFTEAAKLYRKSLDGVFVGSCLSNKDAKYASMLLFYAITRGAQREADGVIKHWQWNPKELPNVEKWKQLRLMPVRIDGEVGFILRKPTTETPAVLWTSTRNVFQTNGSALFVPYLASTTQKQQGTTYQNSVVFVHYCWTNHLGKFSWAADRAEAEFDGMGHLNVAMTRRRNSLFLVGQTIEQVLVRIYRYSHEKELEQLKRTYEWHAFRSLPPA